MDAGIKSFQLSGCLCQQAHAVCFSRADIDISDNNVVRECNFMFGFLYQIQDFFRSFPEDHPFFCQCHFAGAFRAADQQLFSQFFLHVFDLCGKRGLGEVKGFGGPYDALFPCDGEKILKYP